MSIAAKCPICKTEQPIDIDGDFWPHKCKTFLEEVLEIFEGHVEEITLDKNT